jgi:hypothetical protein
VAASSIAVLRLDSASDVTVTGPVVIGTPTAVRSLYVDNINRTDVKPSIGTNRQLLRSIDVGGSARAPAAVTIEHASSSLGDVLAYIYPDTPDALMYSPPLRQYRVSGGTVTADATQVSGSTEPLFGSTATFDIPYAAIADGSHLLMVRTTCPTGVASAAFVNWTAQTRINSTNVGPAKSGSGSVPFAAGMAISTLARLQVPLLDVDPGSTTAVLRLTLTASFTGTGTMTLDEGWLFNTTKGALIQVACGTATAASGGPARRVFITPPTVIRPRPSVRIGHAADGSDSYFPSALSGTGFLSAWQLAHFLPPRVKVFTVTTNALDASVSMQAARRWHTNPGS